MHTNEIQKRVDQLAASMLAKGLPAPQADFEIRANANHRVTVSWHTGPGNWDRTYEGSSGFDPATILDEAAAIIASLPSAEENRRNAFLSALGKVIDLGRENGIEVEFINPLVKTMKRLAEAAITDQRGVQPAE